jgi:hypothetical protein
MKYDLGVVVPVCSRFRDRIEDFKKYGLVNFGERRVLLNLLLSNEDFDGLELGWNSNVDVRAVKSDCPDHISNIYRFYAMIDPEQIDYRWLVRVDDDSCTDIDGLVSSLDRFYDWNENFYLGTSLQNFDAALGGNEGHVYPQYSHLLGDYERMARGMKNEVECGIISATGLKKMLNERSSLNLLKFRSRLRGGYGDCVVALAAAMAKVHPVDCPFLTHFPALDDFSLLGGKFNHIHMISRRTEGENFHWERAPDEMFVLLTKIVDKKVSEIEDSIKGKKFLLDTEDTLKTYEFKDNHILVVKFEHHNFLWMEHDGTVYVFNGKDIAHRFSLNADGSLSEGGLVMKRV